MGEKGSFNNSKQEAEFASQYSCCWYCHYEEDLLMNDNKNTALSDELFENIAGGFGNAQIAVSYDAFGTVIMLISDGSYIVRFDDGGEVTATAKDGKTIAGGAKVGLLAISGTWIMDDIMI